MAESISSLKKAIATYDAEIGELRIQLSNLEQQQAEQPSPEITSKRGIANALLQAQEERDARAAAVGRHREAIAELQQQRDQLQSQLNTSEEGKRREAETKLAQEGVDAFQGFSDRLEEINRQLQEWGQEVSVAFAKYDQSYRAHVSQRAPGIVSGPPSSPIISGMVLALNHLQKDENPGPQRSAWQFSSEQIALPTTSPAPASPETTQ